LRLKGEVILIFVTGDIHRHLDINKLNIDKFPQQKVMTKNDFLIVAGDFGIGWDNSKEDLYWRKWLHNKSFSTLFVDGNHENFDFLDSLEVHQWNGGKVHFINDSIIHLMRGQVYSINGIKIFTFGGAESTDKFNRTPGISWWERELPSFSEYNEGLDNLEKHSWQVDYIVTHDCSERTFEKMGYNRIGIENYTKQPTNFFEVLEEKVSFKHWYFGHYHDDKQLDEFHTVLYDKIIEIS
jgi:predicted phosphodiesterase